METRNRCYGCKDWSRKRKREELCESCNGYDYTVSTDQHYWSVWVKRMSVFITFFLFCIFFGWLDYVSSGNYDFFAYMTDFKRQHGIGWIPVGEIIIVIISFIVVSVLKRHLFTVIKIQARE